MPPRSIEPSIPRRRLRSLPGKHANHISLKGPALGANGNCERGRANERFMCSPCRSSNYSTENVEMKIGLGAPDLCRSRWSSSGTKMDWLRSGYTSRGVRRAYLTIVKIDGVFYETPHGEARYSATCSENAYSNRPRSSFLLFSFLLFSH